MTYSGFSFIIGGERGIRTPGGVTLNGFQDRRNRPLCHLSNGVCLHLTGWCRGYRRYVVCICETVYGFLLCGAKVCIFFELCKWFGILKVEFYKILRQPTASGAVGVENRGDGGGVGGCKRTCDGE